jgi:hypothetical protein
MGRIKVGKQPFSDLSSYSLRDFLRDNIFEFNLFHKIALTRFYYPDELDKVVENSPKNPVPQADAQADAQVIKEETGKNDLNLFGPIADKNKAKLPLLDRMLAVETKFSSLTQKWNEPSNFFFIKRNEKEAWSKEQYAQYIALTEKLNTATLEYYKKCQAQSNQNGEQQVENSEPVTLSKDSYIAELVKVSKLEPDKVKRLLLQDMHERKQLEIGEYFSDTIITLTKTATTEKEKQNKNVDVYETTVTKLLKTRDSGLLFHFDDNYRQVLKGFTIDLRVYFNLIRKIIIIKLNSEKIWTRQFYSQDLKKIFLVLKPLESVYENRALVGLLDSGRRLLEADRARVHRPAVAGAAGQAEQAVPSEGQVLPRSRHDAHRRAGGRTGQGRRRQGLLDHARLERQADGRQYHLRARRKEPLGPRRVPVDAGGCRRQDVL